MKSKTIQIKINLNSSLSAGEQASFIKIPKIQNENFEILTKKTFINHRQINQLMSKITNSINFVSSIDFVNISFIIRSNKKKKNNDDADAMFFALSSSKNLIDKLMNEKIRNENFQNALLNAKKTLLKAYEIESISYILDVVDIIDDIKTRKNVSKKFLKNKQILQMNAKLNKVLKNIEKSMFSKNNEFFKAKNSSSIMQNVKNFTTFLNFFPINDHLNPSNTWAQKAFIKTHNISVLEFQSSNVWTNISYKKSQKPLIAIDVWKEKRVIVVSKNLVEISTQENYEIE